MSRRNRINIRRRKDDVIRQEQRASERAAAEHSNKQDMADVQAAKAAKAATKGKAK